MIKPMPFLAICKKCGHIKLVAPKSDALTPIEGLYIAGVCPKCGGELKKITLPYSVGNLLSIFK